MAATTGLVKVLSTKDLFGVKSTDRIKVNGEVAGVIFTGQNEDVPVFLRADETGKVYEIRTDEDCSIGYNSDGSITVGSNWRLGYYNSNSRLKDGLKGLGVID